MFQKGWHQATPALGTPGDLLGRAVQGGEPWCCSGLGVCVAVPPSEVGRASTFPWGCLECEHWRWRWEVGVAGGAKGEPVHPDSCPPPPHHLLLLSLGPPYCLPRPPLQISYNIVCALPVQLQRRQLKPRAQRFHPVPKGGPVPAHTIPAPQVWNHSTSQRSHLTQSKELWLFHQRHPQPTLTPARDQRCPDLEPKPC